MGPDRELVAAALARGHRAAPRRPRRRAQEPPLRPPQHRSPGHGAVRVRHGRGRADPLRRDAVGTRLRRGEGRRAGAARGRRRGARAGRGRRGQRVARGPGRAPLAVVAATGGPGRERRHPARRRPGGRDGHAVPAHRLARRRPGRGGGHLLRPLHRPARPPRPRPRGDRARAALVGRRPSRSGAARAVGARSHGGHRSRRRRPRRPTAVRAGCSRPCRRFGCVARGQARQPASLGGAVARPSPGHRCHPRAPRCDGAPGRRGRLDADHGHHRPARRRRSGHGGALHGASRCHVRAGGVSQPPGRRPPGGAPWQRGGGPPVPRPDRVPRARPGARRPVAALDARR